MSNAALRKRLYEAYVTSGQAANASESVEATIRQISQMTPYLRHVIARHFPDERNAAITDVGCGYGALVQVARYGGYTNVSGIDSSREQVELARKLGISGVEQADAMSYLEARRNFLDVIVAFDVLEHFSKDEALGFGDAAFRALRPGGRLIAHVPNAESPFFGRIRYGDLTHELAFTPSSISALLTVCGFSHIDCFEESPVVHGAKSALRAVLWRLIRAGLRFYLAVETGAASTVLSQNMLVVASR